jgi:hypothetical protein
VRTYGDGSDISRCCLPAEPGCVAYRDLRHRFIALLAPALPYAHASTLTLSRALFLRQRGCLCDVTRACSGEQERRACGRRVEEENAAWRADGGSTRFSMRLQRRQRAARPVRSSTYYALAGAFWHRHRAVSYTMARLSPSLTCVCAGGAVTPVLHCIRCSQPSRMLLLLWRRNAAPLAGSVIYCLPASPFSET